LSCSLSPIAVDLLYKDSPKHWTALCFNLQLMMMKSHHGWSDTSFNNLLRMLADTYPEGSKVPSNTYRAKKMIRTVSMKLKKLNACTTILCIGVSMRICRAVRTAARVGTKGMPVVAVTWMTRDPRVGRTIRSRPSRSCYWEWGRRGLHAEEKSYPVNVVPTHDRSPACAIRELRGCHADVVTCIGRTHQGR
jgi:hypothetical protein